MIYKDLYVSLLVYFKKELTILRVEIDVLDIFQFGHLPVVRCLPDEDVCQILIQSNCVFCSFYKTDPTAKYNFVAGSEAHYLNF